jgi:hypothetical protein
MTQHRRPNAHSLKFVWTCCVRDDPAVGGKAHHVALTLASFMSNEGECKPSLATIARSAGVSKTTVIGATADLVSLGYLSISLGGGRKHPNIYRALVPRRVDSVDPYVRDVNGRGFAKRVEFEGPKGRAGEPEGRSEGGRSVLEGVNLEVRSGSKEAERANELAVLAECDALVAEGVARWAA